MRRRGIRRLDRHVRRWARHLASNYIQSLDAITAGDKVVLCCRVSTRQQRHGGNLVDSEAELRAVSAARGATVVDVVRHAGPGYEREWLDKLAVAATTARQHGAKLLAETTSRFIRHPEYHSQQRPAAQAGWDQLEELRCYAGDVPLVMVLRPDAGWRAERAYHTQRGQQQKGRNGGRPRNALPGVKKSQRLRALPKVRWMKWVGLSNRQIAKMLRTSESNVRRWGAPFLRRGDAGERD